MGVAAEFGNRRSKLSRTAKRASRPRWRCVLSAACGGLKFAPDRSLAEGRAVRFYPPARGAAEAATAAASARVRTPSLTKIRLTWCSTVFGERKSRPAIWALLSP